MKQMNDLWRERFRSYTVELRRYSKYMFNDHLLFVLIFGGGAAVYYYSNWVKTLTSSFPAGWVMAAILGVILTASPVYTLLKEADIVFLLPMETRMDGYFKKGIRLSFFLQSYFVVVGLAILMPLYVKVTGKGFQTFFPLLAIFLAAKYWNVWLRWQMLKFGDQASLMKDQIARFAMNVLLIYFIVEVASLWIIGAVVLVMAAYAVFFRGAAKDRLIKWDVLIEKEQNRMQMFYRAANMFTDVPHLKGEVKRRKWLDFLFVPIPYGSEETYRYLFSRSLVRTAEYSGLIVRLTVIAGLLVYINSNLYVSLAIGLGFIYLTGFQLLPIIRRHDSKIWTNLYPVSPALKQKAVVMLIMKVLIGQAILFAIVAAVGQSLLNGACIGAAGLAFSILFSRVYAVQRLRKSEKYR